MEFVIAGGLGNQLFMLCAGMYFAERFGCKVTFDIADLERISNLHPGLNVYDLGLIGEDQISRINYRSKKYRRLALVSRKFTKAIQMQDGFSKKSLCRINEIGFVDLDCIPESIQRIEGYFQTWRFFSALSKKPMLGMQSVTNPSDWFLEQKELLQGKDFAGFHIRRGDYKQSTNYRNGMLSTKYFQRVADQLPVQIEILVFTDSPDEVSAELGELKRRFRIVKPPTESDPVESLLLMSQASYIAISNSTFSWWAATLATKNAVIFAPTKWFELRDDPIDLIPNHWIKIQSEWRK